ncbi:major facilitator superfamily domain-containing protein [Xylariales sp. PMI_506]|nr:major facilitator superfamily domain-containing protein [Xylariales sp. PMI_506]
MSEDLDKKDSSVQEVEARHYQDGDIHVGEDERPSRPGSKAGRRSRTTSRTLSRPTSGTRDGIDSQRDLERSQAAEEKTATTVPEASHPDLVTWAGSDDPENPKNWPSGQKWLIIFIVSTFTFMSPLSSSMVAPSLKIIGDELGIQNSTEQAVVMSIFVLAYALGPLAWGPLSEVYGRTIILQGTNLIFLLFNLACGLARTKGQLIAFRFLSGFGGSAPLAIGGGVLSDLITPEKRGRAISTYSLMPLLGPALGPLIGAFITEHTTWRWVFYAVTIADATVQVSGLFFLRETYAPVLLSRKRDRLVRETGNTGLRTPFDNPDRTLARTLQIALTRPFRLLATQVIVQVLALYMMYLYGLIYITLVAFPALFSQPRPEGYGESLGVSGLNYLSLGLGFFLGSQVAAPLQDRVYVALKRRNGGGAGRPEYRVPMMVPGAVLVPVGLLIYGWTAEYKVHWIAPNIGACVFAAGSVIGFQCVQTFLVDAYTRYAASAIGAATVLRSLAGFGFPLFASSLFDRLGLGWGCSLLALVGVLIGWPSPILLWFYGEKLRKKSPFAAGG